MNFRFPKYPSLSILIFIVSVWLLEPESLAEEIEFSPTKDPFFDLSMETKETSLEALGDFDAQAGASDLIELLLISATEELNAQVGEDLEVLFFSADFPVKSYSFFGELPPGVVLSNIVTSTGVGRLTGVPSQPGSWDIEIFGWEELDEQGNASIGLRFTVVVEAGGPVFSSQPEDQNLEWAESLSVSADLDDLTGVTFQWLKDGVVLSGATDASYQLDQVMSSSAGNYHVLASGPFGDTLSEAAIVSVAVTAYDSWRESQFADDPFSPQGDHLSDADGDGALNLLEYGLGTDVRNPTDIPQLKTSVVEIDQVLYTIVQYNRDSLASDVDVAIERKSGEDVSAWASVDLMGTSVEDLSSGSVQRFRWPFVQSMLYRLNLAKVE